MKKLHKNTGKHRKEFQIGRTLMLFNISENPDVRFPFRKWGWESTSDDGLTRTITENVISWSIISWYCHGQDKPIKAHLFHVGPFSFYISRVKKRKATNEDFIYY